MDIEQKLGPEANLSIKSTADKKIRLEIAYDGQQADAGAFVQITPRQLIDKLGELVGVDKSPLAKGVLALVENLIESQL